MNEQTTLIEGGSQSVDMSQSVAIDLRGAMMDLPVDRQNARLAEYQKRRTNFRQWLESVLMEGIHYGVVPGCEPKTKEIDGVTHFGVWSKKANGGKGGYEWYPPTQWKPKPSLYAAGADFICDLMGVRDEYESDLVSWQQMGSKAGNAVQKCRLFSRATGELIGEAIGAYYHQYDPNNAVKMASKCAKVGAVINAYGLRDLFSQDEPPQPPHDNPSENPEAPKAPPRDKRKPSVSAAQIGDIASAWKGWHGVGDTERDKQLFKEWCRKITGRDMDPLVQKQWTQEDVGKCCAALSIPTHQEGESLK